MNSAKTATSATIQITNGNTAFSGNDFAIDDIYFGGPRFSDPNYNYQVEAVDPDQDPLAYALIESPVGMKIDEASGLVSWGPGGNDVGIHDVKIEVTDGRGGVAVQAYELRVLPDEVNQAPIIVSDPVESLFIPNSEFDTPYEYNVVAIDDDGDQLNWSLVDGPDGMLVDPTSGKISWPAEDVFYDQHNVTVRVEDGRGGVDEQTYVLDVFDGVPGGITGQIVGLDEAKPVTVQAIVPGTSNPYLSGLPDGSTAPPDVAPDESPVFY